MSIDLVQLQDALKIAAQIVARDGEAFLPIFLRLEDEVAAANGRNSALERALALSGGEGRTAA